MTSSSATAPLTTELAFFTAADVVFSVSSLSNGLNVVDGKTLTAGGPGALVGGDIVSVGTGNAGLQVQGTEVGFSSVTYSYSASGSSSVAVSSAGVGGHGNAAGVPTQRQSAGAAAPAITAGAGVMVGAIGAAVGMLVM